MPLPKFLVLENGSRSCPRMSKSPKAGASSAMEKDDLSWCIFPSVKWTLALAPASTAFFSGC